MNYTKTYFVDEEFRNKLKAIGLTEKPEVGYWVSNEGYDLFKIVLFPNIYKSNGSTDDREIRSYKITIGQARKIITNKQFRILKAIAELPVKTRVAKKRNFWIYYGENEHIEIDRDACYEFISNYNLEDFRERITGDAYYDDMFKRAEDSDFLEELKYTYDSNLENDMFDYLYELAENEDEGFINFIAEYFEVKLESKKYTVENQIGNEKV